ncbi:tetratricopeptide repeat protein [Reichenbachiella carrageenanivorans]|uniref:Tetratricopeptide repeat protein n=1 Tax=Reichenbachiella carrageenanivorans TaxID=2979869 RepID=A0ABY6D5G9_9BACT|nr:tetratricopeptide repeat protein [Reichenbachiella carrageenanivorans]UXX81380.1 tetratricopeptide repeat protein [Reichenbachiella carrageenanivorans]UXX81381.1 tetratricopeptide repeat protein [Reichenbachiella carrageenanivorans]
MKQILLLSLLCSLLLHSCFEKKTPEQLVNIAKSHLDNEEYSKALNTYKKLIRTDSLMIEGLYGAGLSLSYMCDQNLEHCSTAIDKFTEAIEIDSTYKNLFYNRGLCYFRIGKYDLAQPDYDRAVSQEPDSSGVVYARALNLLFREDSVLACKGLQRAVELGFKHDIQKFKEVCASLGEDSRIKE